MEDGLVYFKTEDTTGLPPFGKLNVPLLETEQTVRVAPTGLVIPWGTIPQD